MKKSFWKILIPLFLVLGIAMTVTVVALATEKEERPDAMVEILADEDLAKHLVSTYALRDDGYLGIPVDFTVYHDTAFPIAPNANGTTLIMYVVNTRATRTGTDSDVSIIQSMLERGYIVAVADYHNHEKAVTPDLEWSVQHLNKLLMTGNFFTESAYKKTFTEALVVPAGHNIERDRVFWEIDKHSVDGTLDKIVETWNLDFRGMKGNAYLIPWHNNGVRKEAQKGLDGTDPVWYSEGEGERQISYGGKTYVPDPENGIYLYVKHTKANEITDCIKPDGTPIDLNLYMHIIYPTNPENAVPVMTLAASSQNLAASAQAEDRPHLYGYGFDGYGVVIYDYGYVPMARLDHYSYFDGSSIDGGAVTGDNYSYSIYTYNSGLIPTAAMRYIRQLGIAESETFKFNGSIGVIGISKSSLVTHLADKELGYVKSTADGYTEAELIQYADEYIASFGQYYYLYGHSGETRFDAGRTTYTKNGATIDGGERQPWLTYNGSMLASNAQFVYSSCGGTTNSIDENFGPFMTTGHIGLESNGYSENNYIINRAKTFDLPFLGFELVIGHTLVGRESAELGIDPYVGFKDFAHYFLSDAAPTVIYATPLDGGEIAVTSSFTVKFAGIVSASEIAKATVTDENGNLVLGIWESAYGKTEWTFTPALPLAGATEYILTVPNTVKAENGKSLQKGFSASFITELADNTTVSTGATTLTSTVGTTFTITVPSLGASHNRAYLYASVSNDAANTLRLYRDSEGGTLLGEVPLDGIGIYAIEISDLLTSETPGEAVTLCLKAGKSSGVAAPSGAKLSTEDFEDSYHTFAVESPATSSYVNVDGHGKVLSVALKNVASSRVPEYRYYKRANALAMYNILPRLGEMDLGRRFTLTFDIYDEQSRMFTVGLNSISNKNNGTIDYDNDTKNFTTKAGEWMTVTFEFDLQDPNYGSYAYMTKYFSIAMDPTGASETPVYFDNFRLTETVTDVELGAISLSLTTAGGDGYKAPLNVEKPYLVDSSAYATLAEALAAVANGGTVTLQSNVTLTDTVTLTNIGKENITLDLGGYAIRTQSTGTSLISVNDATVKSITVKNGNVYLSGGSLVGFEKSSVAADVKVTLEDVYVGTELGATVRQLLVNNTASASSKVQLTLDECTVDMRERRFKKNPVDMLPTSSESVSLALTVKGGEILLSRTDKTLMFTQVKDVLFAKGERGYTRILLAEPRVFEDASLVTEEGFATVEVLDGVAVPDGYRVFSASLASELSTPYGIIPEEYADKTLYPIALFNRDTLEFVTASNVFIEDGNSYAAFSKLYYSSGNYAIYVRDDIAYTTYAYNLSFFGGDVVVDLGGNTLTYNNALIFQAKNGNANTRVTFKNGTLKANTAGAFLNVNVHTQTQRFSFTFENITFTIAEGKKPTILISKTSTGTTANMRAVTNTVTVKDCTFDMTSFSGKTTLFAVGHPNGIITDSATLIGSDIKGDPATVNLVSFGGTDNATFTLSKNEAGNYLTNTRLTTAPTPDKVIATPEGDLTFSKAITTEGDYTTYALYTDPLATPYGRIPEEYEDKATYPVVLFNAKGEVFLAGTLTSLLGSQNWTWESYVVAYVRCDTTVGWAANFGHLKGTQILDLGGHTLKATSTMFTNQLKSGLNGKSVNWTIKNGTLDLNGQVLMKISENGSGSTSATYTFDGVTLKSVGSKAMLLEDLAGNWTATIGFIFKNCTFYVTGANALYSAQNAAASSNITASMQFIGGHFNYADTLTGISPFASDPQSTGKKSVSFLKDADGEYTFIHMPKGTKVEDTTTYQTEDGALCFMADGDAEGGKYTVYRLKDPALVEPDEPDEPVVDPLETPYGRIPVAYADEATYPVILFNANGEVILAGTLTSLLSSQNWTWYTDLVAYVRCDTTIAYASNLGHIKGNHVIDLGGHTLKATSTMFTNQFKSGLNGKSVNWTIKNGTINLNGQVLMKIAENGSGSTTASYTFEGITFQNVGAKAIVLEELAGNWTATLNMTFADCDISVTGSAAFYSAQDSAASAKISANIKFLGGTLRFADNLAGINPLVSDPASTGKKAVLFGKGTSCTYTSIVIKELEDAEGYAFPTENAPMYLRKVCVENGVATYVLDTYGFVSTYLNLSSDLNMIYRVFLPDGTTATVTFTLDGMTEAVEAYATDENGLYLFKLPTINPALMGKTITAVLEAEIDGESFTEELTYSVKSYLDALKAQNASNEALLSLIDKLLVYGAAAQQYDGQPSADFVTEIGELSDIPESEKTATLVGDEYENAKFVKFGMRLDGAFALRITLEVADTTGLTLVATKGSDSRKYDLSEYEAGTIVVLYEGITAAELSESVTFTLKKDGAEVGKTLTLSPNAYLYLAAANLDANTATLAKAIYAYGKAAKAYAK